MRPSRAAARAFSPVVDWSSVSPVTVPMSMAGCVTPERSVDAICPCTVRPAPRRMPAIPAGSACTGRFRLSAAIRPAASSGVGGLGFGNAYGLLGLYGSVSRCAFGAYGLLGLYTSPVSAAPGAYGFRSEYPFCDSGAYGLAALNCSPLWSTVPLAMRSAP